MTKKINKKEKAYNKMCDDAWDDLVQYREKFQNYKADCNYVPFLMQLEDAIHNLLEDGFCIHTINDMIKEAKKRAVDFQKQKYVEEETNYKQLN